MTSIRCYIILNVLTLPNVYEYFIINLNFIQYIYKCISKSGTDFISQTTINRVNIIVDINFSNGGKHLLPHKHVWINNECVIKESDLDVI